MRVKKEINFKFRVKANYMGGQLYTNKQKYTVCYILDSACSFSITDPSTFGLFLTTLNFKGSGFC